MWLQASDSARISQARRARGLALTTADAEYGQDVPPTPFELEILEGALMVATGARSPCRRRAGVSKPRSDLVYRSNQTLGFVLPLSHRRQTTYLCQSCSCPWQASAAVPIMAKRKLGLLPTTTRKLAHSTQVKQWGIKPRLQCQLALRTVDPLTCAWQGGWTQSCCR